MGMWRQWGRLWRECDLIVISLWHPLALDMAYVIIPCHMGRDYLMIYVN